MTALRLLYTIALLWLMAVALEEREQRKALNGRVLNLELRQFGRDGLTHGSRD